MHTPVLLKEVIEYLDPRPGQRFIDATADGGGHVLAVIERLLPNGKLLGIEWDSQLLEQLELKVKSLKLNDNIILINDSYVNLKQIVERENLPDIDGILFDLGMSSWHIEDAGRGFTFNKDEPLDMRFDTLTNGAHEYNGNNQRITAGEIVNQYSYDELVKILKDYGEERFAKSISAGIAKARKDKPIKTTFELVEIIKRSVPFWYQRGRIHFATRTFQALRIAVNHELENLQSGIDQAVDILKTGGRLAIISFHSLEDRIVKNFFRTKAKEEVLKIITKKPIIAGLAEINVNPRARSAKLRVAEKI